MLVCNWMQPAPIIIGSDTLVSDANQLLTDHNLHGLPVVDDGRLRGLITRGNCLRAAHFVARTQSPDEFEYFHNRLKVSDLMVRNPATVDVNETMEVVLARGQALQVGQFPVMDGDQVVGMISANEVFALAAHFLGAWERRSGVTLAAQPLVPGLFARIVGAVESAGGLMRAIYPIGSSEPEPGGQVPDRRVVVRFHADRQADIVAALQQAGFTIVESVDASQATHPEPRITEGA